MWITFYPKASTDNRSKEKYDRITVTSWTKSFVSRIVCKVCLCHVLNDLASSDSFHRFHCCYVTPRNWRHAWWRIKYAWISLCFCRKFDYFTAKREPILGCMMALIFTVSYSLQSLGSTKNIAWKDNAVIKVLEDWGTPKLKSSWSSDWSFHNQSTPQVLVLWSFCCGIELSFESSVCKQINAWEQHKFLPISGT